MPDTKICRTCGVEKPIDLFYREGRPNVAGVRMPTGSCKACLDLYKRERWEAGAPERAAKQAAKDAAARIRAELPRICHSCGIEKPTSEFYAKDVLKSGAQRYRADCKDCNKLEIAGDEWKRERIRLKSADWREDNPEHARELAKQTDQTRRARDREVEGVFTADDKMAMRRRQDDRCANPMCRVPLDGGGHFDHIVPVAAGGDHWPTNRQLLCDPCNRKKGARDNDDFLRFYAVEKGLKWPPVVAQEALS